VSKNGERAHPELFDNRTFAALCLYLATLLLVGSASLLSGEGTAAEFVAFDNLYHVVLIVQLVLGLFLFPYTVKAAVDTRTSLANLTLTFAAGMPAVAVGAFSSAALWHKMILSQMLVFSLWLLAVRLHGTLRDRLHAGYLYLPISAVLFFGMTLTGEVLADLSTTGNIIASFAIPGVAFSWTSGDYFAVNGWLGVALCLCAFALLSKDLAASRRL
jgi:hypothetical protein